MLQVQLSKLLSWEELKCDLSRVLFQGEFGPPLPPWTVLLIDMRRKPCPEEREEARNS
jgi:hypothetical protein